MPKKPPPDPEKKKAIEELGHRLVVAAKDGDLETVKQLLEAGANPNYADPSSYGKTPLTSACNSGNLELVRLLLDSGAKVNLTDNYAVYTDADLSQTPLTAACACEKSNSAATSLVKFLIQRRADISSAHPKDRNGAIHFAAKNGHEEIVKILLEHKVNANIRGRNRYTPLMYAVEGKSLTIANMLIAAGADIHATSAGGRNALDILITDKKANVDIARLLIDLGADFKNYKAPYGPMHFAASYGSAEVVKLFIEKGARISTKNREGETPMDGAIKHKNYEVVKVLLAHGADPDSRDRSGFGKTLLQYATTTGDADLVREIRKLQMEKNLAKEKKNSTKKKVRVKDLLQVHTVSKTGAMVAAAKSGDLASIKVLVKSGLDTNDRDDWRDETALMTSAGRGKDDIVAYLVEQGADVNAKDAQGNTPLDYAASEDKVEAMKILLARGADIHSKNNLGWNALMQAAFKGQYAAAEMLLKAGSSVDEIDLEKGASALFLAQQGGGKKLVELLKSYGAKECVIRERKPGEPYLLITDCGICTYLSHHQIELSHDYSPEEIPGLEIIHESGSTDYKADTTSMIKKCLHCGTYYSHHHFVDTEDPIGGIGADINQSLSRISLFEIQISLHKLDKKEELAEIQARYPAIVESFIELCKAKTKFMPYILPYVAETLVDYFMMKEDWMSIKTLLLEHPDPKFAQETVKHMRYYSNMTINKSNPPQAGDLAYAELKKNLKKMLRTHNAELKRYA